MMNGKEVMTMPDIHESETFNEIESQVSDLEERIDEIDSRIEDTYITDELESRIEDLESTVEMLKNSITEMAKAMQTFVDYSFSQFGAGING